jgi:hypothetical protein
MSNSTYDELIEERAAFAGAGMAAKVAEWDFKINAAELERKYPRITFREIAKELGIEGLQKAVDARVNKQWEAKRKLVDTAKEICGELLQVKKLSESKMYDFINKNQWRYANDPELTSEIMELLTPKLTGTVKTLFETMFMANRKKVVVEAGKVAFIKVERISDYSQNDNPPMVELMKAVEARLSGIFDELYIAYPMVGHVKQIDPIIFGTKVNPNKPHSPLDGAMDRHPSGMGFLANDEITMDRLDSRNFGEMFKVGQWA